MGYGNYGCDVGGYRGNDGTKYATHFLRSAQLNAFLPLMENGGGGEHRPWTYTEKEVVPVYRKFVNQHYRLSAYLLTNGANSVDGKCHRVFGFSFYSAGFVTKR
jgi:alpha-glucosidase (family GH31 glycosyl hydrolase)